MANEIIEKARQQYRNSEIDFKELHRIFFDHATDSEKEDFWSAPVYDRPGVIQGKSQSQMDQEWDALTGTELIPQVRQ